MSQSDFPRRANAWMDLDDEALSKAMDTIFDGGTVSKDGAIDESAAILDQGAPDRGAASLLDFTATCRAALGSENHVGSASELAPGGMESEALRERRVAARVLARTTRGDSVIDFVAEKLRRSPLLRLAAAVLVVQVTVVPLIAWHLTTLPEPDGFLTGIEPPPEVFEQDLPRLREPIEEAETKHEELLGLGSSLSAVVLEVTSALELPSTEATAPLDQALIQLALVARDAHGQLIAAPASTGSSSDLLVHALTLEARLMAFDNARRSDGLGAALQGLADAMESPGSASPAALGLAARALDRAASLNLPVPEVSNDVEREKRDWLTCMAEALSAEAPSPTVDAWLRAIQKLSERAVEAK